MSRIQAALLIWITGAKALSIVHIVNWRTNPPAKLGPWSYALLPFVCLLWPIHVVAELVIAIKQL